MKLEHHNTSRYRLQWRDILIAVLLVTSLWGLSDQGWALRAAYWYDKAMEYEELYAMQNEYVNELKDALITTERQFIDIQMLWLNEAFKEFPQHNIPRIETPEKARETK